MKKIVIIGSHISSFKASEVIRLEDKTSEILIIDHEATLPCDQEQVPAYIAGSIPQEELFYQAHDFLDQNNIQFITDKKIVKINFRRNDLTTEEKELIPFDILVLADLPEHKLPDVKGKQKTGVFGYRRFKDVKEALKEFDFASEVTIESDSLQGLRLAMAIKNKAKHTYLIVPGMGLFSWALEKEEANWLAGIFQQKGLNIYSECSVSEILGDVEMKAVKLSSGKALSSQIVFFERTREDYRIIAGSLLELDQAVIVDENFKSNLDNVYACSNICQQEKRMVPYSNSKPFYKKELQEYEGQKIAYHILEKEQPLGCPVLINSYSDEETEMSLIGDTEHHEDKVVHKILNKDLSILKVFYFYEEKLVGALLVNAQEDPVFIAQLVEQKANYDQISQFLSINDDRKDPFEENA